MKGGVASANGVVTIGAPAGYRITGRITDPGGIPLEGVRVDNAGTNLSSYLGGYTDSDGRYVITGVPGDLTLNAVKYGFTFAPSPWSNPLSVGSNMVNINFIATPMTTVNLAVTTNSLPENSTNTQFFTLTRTGATNADLLVTLNLSGTATDGSDYTLTP